jgi:hypothetical protein
MIARYPIELVAGSTSCTVRQQRGPKMGVAAEKREEQSGRTWRDWIGSRRIVVRIAAGSLVVTDAA